MGKSKFSSFDKLDLAFASINGHKLEATILTPKKLQEKASEIYPVLVYWHGGGFVVGHRMLIELALSHDAIIISPDYRLLPEANGADTLNDVESFWDWLHGTLPSIAKSWHARPDLTKIACCGQSCGGRLATQSALLFPQSKIRAIISISAPLHGNVPHFTVPKPKIIMGSRPPPPRQAEAIIRTYIKSMKPEAVRTGCDPSDMWELVLCIIQQGWLPRLMGAKADKRLDIMAVLDDIRTMPPIWVIHGEQDSIAPANCSTEFVAKVKSMLPDVPLLLTLQPGDHTFEALTTMNEPWVQEGCRFLLKFWL